MGKRKKHVESGKMKAFSVLDRIDTFLAGVCCLLTAFIGSAICYQVAMRYFFNRPSVWVDEICRYGILYITFLGAAWVLAQDGHVKVDLILNRLKPETQALLNAFNSIISAIVCLLIVWYGARVTWENIEMYYRLETALAPPQFAIVIAIPVGSFFFFLGFLRKSYRYLTLRKASRMSPGAG